MASVAGEAVPTPPGRPRVDEALATARTCYDHIAGRLAVAIADVLQDRGDIVFADASGEVTPQGQNFFSNLGVDLKRLGSSRRVFCRPCVDWTERRHHIAGAVGATLYDHCLTCGWVRRARDSRALTITPDGQAAFADLFGIDTASVGRITDRAVAAA